MTWQDTRQARTAIGTVARVQAHTDDAKQRRDETHLHREPRRPGWPVLAAVVVAVVLAGVGGAAALTSHRSGSPRTTRTGIPRSATSNRNAGSSSSSTSAEYDVSGTATEVSLLGEGGFGTRYPVVPVKLHVACGPSACTVSRVRAGGARAPFVVRALQHSLRGHGPWTLDQGPAKSCATAFPQPLKVSLSIAGDRVTEISRGYTFYDKGVHFCVQNAPLITFRGTRVG